MKPMCYVVMVDRENAGQLWTDPWKVFVKDIDAQVEVEFLVNTDKYVNVWIEEVEIDIE